MIPLIAYVPPRDLRPPFCPPHLVAHSDYLGDHRTGAERKLRSERRGVERRREHVGRTGARRRPIVLHASAWRVKAREVDQRGDRSANRGGEGHCWSGRKGGKQRGRSRRGSRYEHLCGQFPVIPRVERARMIHVIAYVPPRDLRPPFCPPQLVAHSDYLGDHRLARSTIFRVSDEVWREEGST